LSPHAWERLGLLTPGLIDTRHEYDHVFGIYVPIAIGVFAVIVLAMTFAVLVYRVRPSRPPEQAARWHENNPLEGGYAIGLALVVAFLLYVTFTAEHRVDTVAAAERPALTIDVTGAKWEWQFAYRGYGFTTQSGTAGRQPLVVPTGEAIRFTLRSLDVIHAFWIPALRYKRDLTPGSVQQITLTFTRTGVFGGQCAEFCGLRHSDMVFAVHAVSPTSFATWARSRGKGPVP
jgi:cytochrome c oxidase subunit II